MTKQTISHPCADAILCGDSLALLKDMPDGCVDMCVTSPPYFALRDYGVEGQIGMEETPDEYVGRLGDVFDEVRRVLREDGTLWLNIGDSYNGSGGNHKPWHKNDAGFQGKAGVRCGGKGAKVDGLKPKDMVGVPWMLAFELRRRGWYLRQDIIWSKPNPMPEPAVDRCVRSHEYLFLLSKSPKYRFDGEALKGEGARRSVWSVPVKPCREAHFAVFPEELVDKCVLAGSVEGDLVLDPFMGSGTTAVVCRKLGRRYAGCELNPEYVKIAESRLERLGSSLFGL